MAAILVGTWAAHHPALAQTQNELDKEVARLYAGGKYAEAVPLAQRAVKLKEHTFGPDHPETATSLNNLAALYQSIGDYAKAAPLFQRALAITENALGPDHPSTATSLNNLATHYMSISDYEKAVPLSQRALAIREKVLGPGHPDTATSLNNLAALYQSMGDYAKAEPLFQRALAVYEKALGPDRPETATSLNYLATLYWHMGNYAKAVPLSQRALAIQEKMLGPEHPDTATSLNNLARLYEDMGDYARAEPLFQRALAINEKTLGPERPETATILSNLAALYDDMGDYARAEPLYQRTLAINEKAFGPDHPYTAKGLNNLAALYESMGDYAKVEPLYQRALAINEKTLGPERPETATNLNNLAALYQSMGDYAKAEPLSLRALAIREKILGPEHPDTAPSLNNLATLYEDMGDYARAEPLFQRALAINEKAFGPDHPYTAKGLNNLAALYQSMGDYAKVEPLYQRALAINEKTLGPERPETATSLNNLAGFYGHMADYARAAPLCQRALAINEKVLGPEHTDTSASLSLLASLYANMGDYAKAEPLQQRALAIREKALGPNHPSTARSINSLAFIRLDLGEEPGARELIGRVQQAQISMLANVLSFASEQQRFAYQATLDPYALFATMGNARAITQAILHFKGVVLDSVLEDRLVAMASRDPKDLAVLDELRAAKQRVMQLTLEVPRDLSSDAREHRLAERHRLETKVEQLEQTLARHVAATGRTRRALRVTVEQVQGAIPAHAVLLEFIRYDHYLGKEHSEPRYGVVVLASSGEPRWVPLGSAAAIEASITRYRQAIQQSVRRQATDTEMTTILQALYQQLWAPLDAALPPETATVILSPDAALNFISFATVLTPADQFLAAAYSLRYVASGRDLLRTVAPSPAVPLLTLYANPDFADRGAPPAVPRAEHNVAMRALEIRDFKDLHLQPLRGTHREAVELEAEAKQWKWGVERFEQGEATEKRLRTVRSPRVLHLATHGFFLEDTASGDNVDGPDRLGVGDVPLFGRRVPSPVFTADVRPPVVLKNPMHRSGLALAGAQATFDDWARGLTPPTESDGILTAAEVGDLQLDGTWLVTLSACDTGTGEIRAGEGVLGLRRGFIQAGAQNLLMTLWSVEDMPTAQVMLDFYAAAQRDGNAPRALARVQRDWLVSMREQRGLAAAVAIAGPFILSSQGPLE